MSLPYTSRIRLAAENGDLDKLADLVKEGADGSRILTNEEVGELATAIHTVSKRLRVQRIIAIVVTVLAVVSLAVVA